MIDAVNTWLAMSGLFVLGLMTGLKIGGVI